MLNNGIRRIASLLITALPFAAIATTLAAAAERTPAPVFAMAGPRSGPEAAHFAMVRDAAEDALRAINRRGGFQGGNAELRVVDDGCDAATATATARALVAEGADIVIGHPCLRAALAAAAVYAPSDVAFFAVGVRHPRLTDGRAPGLVFRLGGRDDRADVRAADQLSRIAPVGSIVLVHDRTRYGRALTARIEKRLSQRTGRRVVTVSITAGDKDYGKLIATLKPAAAVFFAGFPLEAGLIYRQLRAAGGRAPFVVSETAATGELTGTFGDGVRGIQAIVSDHSALLLGPVLNPAPQQAASAPPERTPPPADVEDVRAIIDRLDQVARSGIDIRDRVALRAALTAPQTDADTPANGRQPRLQFDANGDARRDGYAVVIWNGSAWARAP